MSTARTEGAATDRKKLLSLQREDAVSDPAAESPDSQSNRILSGFYRNKTKTTKVGERTRDVQHTQDVCAPSRSQFDSRGFRNVTVVTDGSESDSQGGPFL